ncbi:hypothetical protein J6590_108402 [Homalodisca vitripennis]|nr:hypothetical protein J6590_108402 [Homalodisca vitripennis]
MEVEENKAVYTDLDAGTIETRRSNVDGIIKNNVVENTSEEYENVSNIKQQDQHVETHNSLQNYELFSDRPNESNSNVDTNESTHNVDDSDSISDTDCKLFVETIVNKVADNIANEVVVPKKKKNGYSCLICSKKFSQNAGRYNHMRNKHGIHPGEKTNVRCLEKNCNFTCSYKEKLQLHLSEIHGLDMVITMKSFDSLQEFLRWKDVFERQEKSRFVKKSGSRVREEGIRVAYYYCSRSGSFVSHGLGIKNSKKKGTSKTNHHCTASITCVELPGGKIEVKICSTHYGHDTDLQHLRLTQTEKYQIAEQLCKGVPRDLILDNVRSSAGPEVDRIHLITMKDVKNIEKAFGIQAAPKEKTNNMFYNLTEWISSIMQTEHCPVLYFKEDAVFTNKNYCLTLILLTTGQQEVLNRYGKNGIYYVTTSVSMNKQHLANYPYRLSIYLTALILVDDLNEAVPVSFLISNRGDNDKYKLFFKSLKKKIPGLSAKVVITDDKKEIYEVWRDVFEEEPCHLWSNRFVDSEWRENLISIPDEELQVAIYEKLYSFLESQDQNELESSLESYIYELQSNEVTSAFGSYFASRFIGTEMLWAGCYGKKNVSVGAHLNMENLYNEIEESGQKRHWDRNFIVRIVQNLLKLVSDKQCVRQTRLHRQIQEIPTHHDLALSIKPETIKAESDCWRVNSVKDPVNIFSKVTQIKESCDPTACILYCSKCNVCVHQFKCTCRVHAYDRTMCKHIHAVALRCFVEMQNKLNVTSNDVPGIASVDPLVNVSGEVISSTEGNSKNSGIEPLPKEELVPIDVKPSVWRRKNKKQKSEENTNENNMLTVLEDVIKGERVEKHRPPGERKRGRPRKSDVVQEVCDENKVKSVEKKRRGLRTSKSLETVTKTSEETSVYAGRLRPHRINILRKFKESKSKH